MKLLLTFLLLLTGTALSAQLKTTITGTVQDSVGNQLPLATITIDKVGSKNSIIRRVLTNKEGKFQIENIDTGRYRISISLSGFIELKKAVTATDTSHSMGIIQLKSLVSVLRNVTVTATKPLITATDDKIIFNVDQDPSAKTETALDILRKTPFVLVDGSTILVNGQNNFRILLNGRETAMFATNPQQALQAFPGVTISRIEVITNPSAKYDAEGIGGILNIITVKKLKGYNGTLYTGYSTLGFLNSNMSYSLKTGKWGLVANYSYGWNGKGLIYSVNNTTIPKQASVFDKRITKGSQENKFFFNAGNAEITYDLDSFSVLSIFSNIGGGWNQLENNQLFTTVTNGTTFESNFDVNSKNANPSYTVGSEFIKRFKRSKEEELSFRLYGDFNYNANTYASTQSIPGNNQTSYKYILNDNQADNKQYTFQGDYIKPLRSTTKIEAGIKYIQRHAISDFLGMLRYDALSPFKTNPNNTNYFTYQQQVYSGYLIYHFKLKKTSWRAGARIERTAIDGKFQTTNTSISQNYTNFFPNLQVSFPAGKKTSFVINYNKRIQRPFITTLNPFTNDNDSLNISSGNPYLNPQLFHSISIQARINTRKVFAGLSLTGSYSGDRIIAYTVFNTISGVSLTTPQNFGKEMQLGLNGNFSASLSKKIRLLVNGLAQYITIKNATDISQVNTGWGYRMSTTMIYTLNATFTLTAGSNIFKVPSSLQTDFASVGTYLISGGAKLLKDKLLVNLNIENFLSKTYKIKNTVETPGFLTQNVTTQPFQLLRGSITWNFGKLKEAVSRKKGINNEDIGN